MPVRINARTTSSSLVHRQFKRDCGSCTVRRDSTNMHCNTAALTVEEWQTLNFDPRGGCSARSLFGTVYFHIDMHTRTSLPTHSSSTLADCILMGPSWPRAGPATESTESTTKPLETATLPAYPAKIFSSRHRNPESRCSHAANIELPAW